MLSTSSHLVSARCTNYQHSILPSCLTIPLCFRCHAETAVSRSRVLIIAVPRCEWLAVCY
jgi:hypothetical protein